MASKGYHRVNNIIVVFRAINGTRRLYSNISQILLQYKTWGHYNKFDPTKSLGVYQNTTMWLYGA